MCCGEKDSEKVKARKQKYRDADYADPNYEGEPTDNALADGPYTKRSCTDVCCCMIFIAYMVGMVYIA